MQMFLRLFYYSYLVRHLSELGIKSCKIISHFCSLLFILHLFKWTEHFTQYKWKSQE